MLRAVLAPFAIIAMCVVAAVAAFYGGVFTTLHDLLLDYSLSLGINASAASQLIVFLSMLLTPLFASAIVRIFFGQLFAPKVLLAVATIAVTGGAYVAVTHEWLFDARGSPLVYFCPPEPGLLPRLQRSKADTTLGGQCIPVSKDTSSAVSALRRGIEPKAIQLTTSAQLVALPTHRYGFPILWIGHKSGVLYDMAGWDAIGGDLLRPVLPSDFPALEAGLVKQKVEQEKSLKKSLSQYLQAAELAAQSADKAQSEVEELHKLARMKLEDDERAQQSVAAAAAKTAEMALKADQLANAKRQTAERERVQRQQALQEQIARENSPKRYFQHASYEDAPLVVVLGELSTQERQAVMGRLSGTRFYAAENTVTGEFYNVVRPHQVVNSDYSGLDKLIVANGIRRIIFAQLISRDCDCNGQTTLHFKVAVFDTAKRLVSHDQRDVTV